MTWKGRMTVRSDGNLEEWVREVFRGSVMAHLIQKHFGGHQGEAGRREVFEGPGAEDETPATPPHHTSRIGTSAPDSVSTLEDKSPLSRRSCWR